MHSLDRHVAALVDASFSDVSGLVRAAGVRERPAWWIDLLTGSIARQEQHLADAIVQSVCCDDRPSQYESFAEQVMRRLGGRNARLAHTRLRLEAATRPLAPLQRAVRYYGARDPNGSLCCWLETFDVKIRVDSFEPCDQCHGSGVVSDRAGRSAGRAGHVCPRCERYKVVPVLRASARIEGTGRFDLPAPDGVDRIPQ